MKVLYLESNYFLHHVFSSSRQLCDEDERAFEEEENSNNRTIMEDGELEQSGNGSSILPPVLPLRNHNSTEAILTSMTSLPSPKTSSSAQHSESNSLKNVKFSGGHPHITSPPFWQFLTPPLPPVIMCHHF